MKRTPKQNLKYWQRQRRMMTFKRKIREFFSFTRIDAKTCIDPINAKHK